MNAMRAHGVAELLNPTYAPDPRDPQAVAEFQEKQNSMYFVLSEKVQTATGKRLVKREEYTANAQAVLYSLMQEGRNSTKAILTGRDLFNKIVTSTFNPSGKETAIEYIATWEQWVETYNEQQTQPDAQLKGLMLKNMLQQAFSRVPYLRNVASREQEAIVRGALPFSFDEYKEVLEHNAVTYDETRVGRRDVHNVNIVPEDSDEESDGAEFQVNVTKSKMPGSSMNKETWNSLDKEEQALWDKLKDSTKRKILQYAKDRSTKRSEAKVNQVMTDNKIKESLPEQPEASTEVEEEGSDQDTHQVMKSAIIKNILEEARSEAHPGDIRRVMGKKKTAQVKFTHRVSDDHQDDSSEDMEGLNALLDSYWDESDSEPDGEDFHRGD